MTKPKRTPIRKAGAKTATTAKIKTDSIKEFQEASKKRGVVESLNLSNAGCIAHTKRHISTQSLSLDKLCNGKGIPCGKITEIFGQSHIGKSTVLDHIFAQCQKEGGVAVLADTEVSRDEKYSAGIGVDTDKLQYLKFASPIPTVEDVMIAVMDTIRFWREKYPETPVVIGWDALGGTATRDELEKFDDEKMAKPGGAAKIMATAKRMIPNLLGGSNIAFVIINHTYEKIQMTGRVGKKRETYGGEAVRFMASLRIELFSKGEWIKRADGYIRGRVIGAKMVKNKLGISSFHETTLAMISGVGVDNTWTLFEDLTVAGLIQKAGSWGAFNLDGEVHKFQGFNGFTALVEGDPSIFQKLTAVHQGI